MLQIGSGNLVRKIGRSLASEKEPIHIFFQNKYKGQDRIDKTATAPKGIKSKLTPYPHINPKDYSRMVFLNLRVAIVKMSKSEEVFEYMEWAKNQ